MADTLNQTQLGQIVGAVIQALRVQGAAPSGAAPSAKPGNSLEAKDRGLIAGFKRKGIKEADIHLMDRNDPTKPYNVRPYGTWAGFIALSVPKTVVFRIPI